MDIRTRVSTGIVDNPSAQNQIPYDWFACKFAGIDEEKDEWFVEVDLWPSEVDALALNPQRYGRILKFPRATAVDIPAIWAHVLTLVDFPTDSGELITLTNSTIVAP